MQHGWVPQMWTSDVRVGPIGPVAVAQVPSVFLTTAVLLAHCAYIPSLDL